MDYSQKKSHPFLILLLVILIGGVAFYSAQYIFNYSQKEKPISSNTATSTAVSSNVFISRVDEMKLPDGITSEMILEKNASIIQKYTAVNKEHTQSQSTIQYISNKTVAETMKLANSYLAINKWALGTYNVQLFSGVISGSKSGKQLMFSINQNPGERTSIVDVTLIQVTSIR